MPLCKTFFKFTSVLSMFVVQSLVFATFANANMLSSNHAQYQKHTFNHSVNSASAQLPYRILYPDNFSPQQRYPVIFFLHGAGERGSDNEVQLTHGADLFLQPDFRKNQQVIVIFPQAASEDYWANVDVDRAPDPNIYSFKVDAPVTQSMSLLLGLIDDVTQRPYVNSDHMMVMGLSMGGMGTFEVLAQRPGRFTAAIPICGGAHPDLVSKMDTSTPLWVFHGEQDNVVPFSASEIMVEAYQNAGGKVKFTAYPEAAHDSWNNAFAEANLLDWLLMQ
jgi:predicted peptidase